MLGAGGHRNEDPPCTQRCCDHAVGGDGGACRLLTGGDRIAVSLASRAGDQRQASVPAAWQDGDGAGRGCRLLRRRRARILGRHVGTCIDIDATRKIELDLTDAAAGRDIALDALDRTAVGIAHEFSNLVGAFLGDLWAIRKNAHDADTVRQRAEQAEDALIEGQRMIEQLLASLRERPRASQSAGSSKSCPDQRTS